MVKIIKRPSKKRIEFDVKGRKWAFSLAIDSSYKRKWGSDSCAITIFEDHEVYFRKSEFTPNTVRHEVFHVYVYESLTNSADLSGDQMEELCAEIMGEHGVEICSLSDIIYHKLLRGSHNA
jgi:hypothetical protein